MTLLAGIVPLDADLYHADQAPEPSLSSSVANTLITRCPYAAWWEHPKLGGHAPEANKVMDLGSYAHACLLEGGTDKLVIVAADDWRTKAAREERDAARAAGKVPILEGKVGEVRAMIKAAREFIAGCELPDLLVGGYAEHAMHWQDDAIWWRARPDWMSEDYAIMVDYKTTTCAEPNAWLRQLLGNGYDLQAAIYSRGIRVLKNVRTQFLFLVQETEEPYMCSLVGMSPMLTELGQSKMDYAATLWARCLDTGEWPGYPSRIAWADPPTWALRQWEESEVIRQEVSS